MQKVLRFCLENWKDIVAVCIFIISLVITLIRKKPSYNEIDKIWCFIDQKLPELIKSAEVLADGAQKKALVLSSITKAVLKEFGLTVSDSMLNEISNRIELILETPSKKGNEKNG